ncbi:MAG: histone deacetylase [Candidatus Omnitrophica bacterium]|nr:histone deacetylase [Candidatus Omnitrophota bacterium]
MKIITDKRCTEYGRAGHPERPERIRLTVEKLRQQTTFPVEFEEPLGKVDKEILRVHSAAHLERLRQPLDFDPDTPAYPRILEYARRAVGGALAALECARRSELAFSLMRPPGHHALRERAMGFCYLNNVAIAVLEARNQGVARVAVYDFDVHHANGTEAILLHDPGCSLFSIHQYPNYPGTGAQSVGNSHNFPVAPLTPHLEYRKVLEKAIEELKMFQPDLVAVSAGFDACRGDPIANELLEPDDYHWLGRSLRALGFPLFGVLEGGYSENLPELVLAFLSGLEGK